MSQLPHLLHRRHNQLHAGTFVKQVRLRLLVAEHLGLDRIDNTIVKADQFTRLHRPHGERVHSPQGSVIVLGAAWH